MPKQLLTGPLEEQVAKLYEIAQDRMRTGAYTGALHYLKEIQRAMPGYRDVPALIVQAEAAKRENSFLLWVSILVAIGAIIGTRALGWTNDLVSIAIGVIGMVAGWFLGSVLYKPFRHTKGRE